jgi:acyl-CoA synthetase (NDP forming)
MMMEKNSLDFVFKPESVAVVGASEENWTGEYVQRLVMYGYQGKVYPINLKQPQVFGYKAYPSIKDIPGTVDYVVQGIGIERTPDILKDCAAKGVKVLHLFAGRSSETGRKELIDLDHEILRLAKSYGIRLIGPNSLGINNFKTRFCTTAHDLPADFGTVSAAVQSGGNSTDLVRWGVLQGLKFGKIASYGNALDLDESDFINYYAQDPETKIIMLYIEGVKDARKFFSALKNASSLKPVIVIKGGKSNAGVKATASHTASVAGSWNIWNTAIRQAGAIPAHYFEEFIDLAVAFYYLPPLKGKRVGIIGGGGGRIALSADECEESGFDLISLPEDMRMELKQKAPAIWDWIGNPTDMTILGGSGVRNRDVLLMMAKHPDFDFLIVNITECWPFKESTSTFRNNDEIDGYIEVHKMGLKPMIAIFGDRSWGTEQLDNWRFKLFAATKSRIRDANIPFFPTMLRGTKAVSELTNYYNRTGKTRK